MINSKCPICYSVLEREEFINNKDSSNSSIAQYNCDNCKCFSIRNEIVFVNGKSFTLKEKEEMNALITNLRSTYQEFSQRLDNAERRLSAVTDKVDKQQNSEEMLFWLNMLKTQEYEIKCLKNNNKKG